jgi:hypothetical protein
MTPTLAKITATCSPENDATAHVTHARGTHPLLRACARKARNSASVFLRNTMIAESDIGQRLRVAVALSC